MYSEEQKCRQYELFSNGKLASESKIAQLENDLIGSLDEADRRITLLGYYAVRDPEIFVEHFTWFIEHDPYSFALGIGAASFKFTADQAQKVRKSWIRKIETGTLGAYALGNAAEFLSRNNDRQLAKVCLAKARLLEPENTRWVRKVFEL